LIALDIALPMLHSTRGKLATDVLPLCADAEQLPLANRSIDSIVSNLAVQWCENIGGVFAEFQRVLQADGSLIFSTFAPQTLHELKTAWASVDDDAHVNEFYSAAQLVAFLQAAGFQHIAVKNTLSVSYYDSVRALMQELKQLGAHNVLAGRKRGMTGKRALQKMIAAYPHCDGQIAATFEVIQITARLA
jgi:malonyl-CoA O-methyltransferase